MGRLSSIHGLDHRQNIAQRDEKESKSKIGARWNIWAPSSCLAMSGCALTVLWL